MIHAFKSRAAVAVLAASSVFAANAADVTGAGASFIYPVMSKWSADYNTATGKKVNYQSIVPVAVSPRSRRPRWTSVRPMRR